MPLQLTAPIYETFTLDRTDERYGVEGGESTTVMIKQATQYEHATRQALLDKIERKYRTDDPEAISFVQNFTLEELMREEAFLTMVECNILDEKGKPLFPSKKVKGGQPALAMTRQQFNDSWGLLPPDVCAEIQEKIRGVNFMWKTGGEGF